ncbi:uncharacterized protein TNIN_430841 [Trichonephila inaurata madagascariensis]|uniref:Uncharacterized protein n=1 Tax=Trichonephila inaurata madagascariensis TaxID=2747483 RepID=A0A8X7BUM0_9ARAC|nr:uncharacterized protein TNIN_430841 [Trichonephila inaurata madagascariensis]
MKNLLNSDPKMSIRMIANELSIPQTQMFEIVTGTLAMRKVRAKFVPRVLSKGLRASRKVICQDLLHDVNEDPEFLDNVVTGGLYVYLYKASANMTDFQSILNVVVFYIYF